jgi:metallo-beta-lactamase class B
MCFFLSFVLAVVLSFSANAQKINEPRTTAEWIAPYQPFRIVGNLYYVGTYDLACYLITTSKGNILINTGLASSESQIENNIEALGFKFSDTKILLTTQAHYDHLGAMAAIRQRTGAQLMVDAKDADVLVSGGSSDYELGKYGTSFKPLKPDRLLNDGESIRLGDMQLVMLHHPGHTKGSCSFLFTIKDEQRSYRVLIANLPTIVTDKKFAEITAYPAIANDYTYTFRVMKNIKFDLWFASHASQFNLHTKHKPGDAYNPAVFKDQAGYDNALSDLQKQYDEKVKKDAQPGSANNKIEEEIIALIDRYSEAREKRDTVLLKTILTPDVDQLVSTGEWRSGIKAAVEGMMKSSATSPGTRTLSVEKIQIIATSSAVVDCRYEIQNTDNTIRKMWSTFIVVGDKKEWKIKAIRNMLPAPNN